MKFLKFLKSKLIIFYLRLKGLDISWETNINTFPKLKIKGRASNIKIEKSEILGRIDLRNRENGKIKIQEGCKIEADTRFVSARNGLIDIGKGTTVTMGAVINGGGNVIIGQNCILGPRIIINANEHVFKKGKLIKDQGFIHKDVIIEDDCWFGANVVINKGVVIKTGSVVGALSLVTKNTEKNSINFGIPSKKFSERLN